jgi:hypothetical protein
MKCVSPNIAATRIVQLGLARIYAEVVRGEHKKYPHGFSIYFERPSEFYRQLKKFPGQFPFEDSVVPLRESNSDHFWCYVPEELAFIEFSIEWREHKVIAQSNEQFVDYEIKRLADCGVEPELLYTAAELLGYVDTDGFLERYAYE